MTNPDTRRVARQFAGSSAAFLNLLVAVERAEGNILRAVQCSEPTTPDRDAALVITARSAVHAMADYLFAHDPQAFVAFWAKRWAPVGAANDPHALNANWPTNVLAFWTGHQ